MNARKAGLITAGVVAALVGGSSAAWAIGPSAVAPQPCSFSQQGEDASDSSAVSTDNPVNLVPQAPLGGNNSGVYGKCSTFNQHNGEGNFQNNGPLPALPLP